MVQDSTLPVRLVLEVLVDLYVSLDCTSRMQKCYRWPQAPVLYAKPTPFNIAPCVVVTPIMNQNVRCHMQENSHGDAIHRLRAIALAEGIQNSERIKVLVLP